MPESNNQGFQIHRIFFLSGLMGIYFLTRVKGLGLIPIFTDEALYVHIAQRINNNWENLFLSKVDAVKPLFIWLTAVFQNYISDPLLAGRWVSVTAGSFSIVGIYMLGREIFSERVGKVSAVIYLFCPFYIFHERMALVDSLVNAFGIWIVWVSFRATRLKILEKKYFILLGVLLGFAFFTKSTALLFLPTPFIIFIIWKTYAIKNFYIYCGLTVSIIFLINIPYSMADLQVGYKGVHPIFSAANNYVTAKQLLSFPVEIWSQNLWASYVYIFTYLTFPIVLVLSFGVFNSLLVKNKTGITLGILFLIPLFLIVLVGQIIFSRYFLIIVPPLVILTGWALVELAKKISKLLNTERVNFFLFVLLICVVSEGIGFSQNIGKNPLKLLLPNVDRYQYLTGHGSGVGIKEAAKFLKSKSKKNPIYILTPRSQGNHQECILVYLWNKPNINIIPALGWPKQKILFPADTSFPIIAGKNQLKSLNRENVGDFGRIFFILPLKPKLRKDFRAYNPDWNKVWVYTKPLDDTGIEILDDLNIEIYELNS
jgi:4-amino-4-deoxy-L-arabinose transferase-like glycosyltransferase